MKPDQTKSEKIINLIKEEDTVALVIGKVGQIKILHSFKQFGGTRTRPTLKVGCLFGNGAKATAIVVNTDQITASKEITIPSGDAIHECNTIKELKNIKNPQIQPTPAAAPTARVTCRSTQVNGGEETPTERTESAPGARAVKMTTYQEVACIIPAPFIMNQIFRGGGDTDPLELILAVKAAAMDFNNLHSTMQEFANVDARVQAKRFAMWAFAAYKSYINKTTFKIEPDNEELQQFCDERHSKCIIPSINQARTMQSNLSNHASILD